MEIGMARAGGGSAEQMPIVTLAQVLERLILRHAEFAALASEARDLQTRQDDHQAEAPSRAFDGIEGAIASMAATTLAEAAVQILIARGYAAQLADTDGAASDERLDRIARLLHSALPVVAAEAGQDLGAAIARRYAPAPPANEARSSINGNPLHLVAANLSPRDGSDASPKDPAPPAAGCEPSPRLDRATIWRRIGEAREAHADFLEALDTYELADVIHLSGDQGRAGAHYERALEIAAALRDRSQLAPAQEWLLGALRERLAALVATGRGEASPAGCAASS